MEKLTSSTQQSPIKRLKEIDKELRITSKEMTELEQQITRLRSVLEVVEVTSFVASKQLNLIRDLLQQPDVERDYEAARENLEKTITERCKEFVKAIPENTQIILTLEGNEELLESFNGPKELERRLARTKEIIRLFRSNVNLKLIESELQEAIYIEGRLYILANRKIVELNPKLVRAKEKHNQLSLEKKALCSSPRDIWEAAAMGRVDFIQEGINGLTLFQTKYSYVNQTNKKKQTPLHVAAAFDQVEVVALLLKNKGDLDLRDHKERTPYAKAHRKSNDLITKGIFFRKARELGYVMPSCVKRGERKHIEKMLGVESDEYEERTKFKKAELDAQQLQQQGNFEACFQFYQHWLRQVDDLTYLDIFRKVGESEAINHCIRLVRKTIKSWQVAYNRGEILSTTEEILKRFHAIFPAQKEKVAQITRKVLESMKKGEILTDQNRKDFECCMELALFLDPLFDQMLTSKDPSFFTHSRVIRLTTLVYREIQRNKNAIQAFLDSPPEFALDYSVKLLRLLTPSVQAGVRAWLRQLNDAPEPTAPEQPGALSGLDSPKTDVLKSLKFPTRSLQEVLKFSKEAKFLEMLKKSVQGEKGNSRLLSWVMPWISLPSSSFDSGLFLATNVTFKQLFSLARLGASKLSYTNMYSSIKALVKGEDVKTSNPSLHGGWTDLLDGLASLKTYMESYRTSKEKDAPLDFQLLLITLVKDEEFFKYLGSAETIEQLGELVAAFEVRDLDKEAFRMIIESLLELHRLVLKIEDKDKIGSWNDLFCRLALIPGAMAILLGKKGLPLLKKLEGLIGTNLKTQITPVEVLALSYMKRLLKGGKAKNYEEVAYFPLERTKFIDRNEVFDAFKNDSLGPLILDPITTFIRSKTLNGCYLTHETPENPQEQTDKVLVCNFNGSAFREFTFRAAFQDFIFKNNFFQRCNFTGTTFVGDIQFEEVFMDAATAKTFIPALWESYRKKSCLLSGKITLVRGKFGKDEFVSIPEGLRAYVDTSGVTFAKWEDIPTPQAVSSSPQLSPKEEPALEQLQSGYLSSVFRGVGGALGYGVSVAQSLVQMKQNWTSSGVQNDYVQEILELQQNHQALEKEIAQLKAKSEGDQQMQRKIDDHFEEQLEDLQALATQIKGKLANKKDIQSEQNDLINHKDRAVRVFYETLLTELSFALHGILLLNNPMGIIDPVTGRIGTLSNKQRDREDRASWKIEIDPNRPEPIKKALRFLQGAINLIDPAVEFLDKTGPLVALGLEKGAEVLLEGVPIVGPALSTGIREGTKAIVKANDASHLSVAGKAMRGQTTKALEKIVDAVSRKVALAYSDQIQLLTEEGAIQFAQAGVLRVVVALLNGEITDIVKFPEVALFKIRKLKVYQNRSFLLDIPFTQQPLTLKDKACKETVTSDQLFRKCGVSYKKGNKPYFYSNDLTKKTHKPDQTITQAKRLKYMLVSEEEWDNYFHALGLGEDEDRLDPERESEPAEHPPINLKSIGELQLEVALLKRMVLEQQQAKK